MTAPIVDPIGDLNAGKGPDLGAITTRGQFASQIYSGLMATNTAYVLSKDSMAAQVNVESMKVMAKQAVAAADLLLSELVNSDARRAR